MEFSPYDDEQKFVPSTRNRPAMSAEQGEESVEKTSDPKYIAEVRLMERSRNFLESKGIRSERSPQVEPGEMTVEGSLREAYEQGANLDPQQVLFAHVLIDSGHELDRERMLSEKFDSLSPGELNHLKRAKAYFRGEVRNVIAASEGGILQDDFASWLGKFSGNISWAEKVVEEEAAKIAMHDYLAKRRDLHVAYASPEEAAAAGYDLTVTPYHEVLGGPMQVRARPVSAHEGDVRMRHGLVELEIPKSQIENFAFKTDHDAEGLAELMSKAGRGTNLAYTSEGRHE